jgi:hypothetical protein
MAPTELLARQHLRHAGQALPAPRGRGRLADRQRERARPQGVLRGLASGHRRHGRSAPMPCSRTAVAFPDLGLRRGG